MFEKIRKLVCRIGIHKYKMYKTHKSAGTSYSYPGIFIVYKCCLCGKTKCIKMYQDSDGCMKKHGVNMVFVIENFGDRL